MNTNAFTQVDELLCMIDVADSNAVYYYHYYASGSVVALSNPNGDTHYRVNLILNNSVTKNYQPRLNCFKEAGVVNENKANSRKTT